jgi:tetratricopeptide (TPR) repeat protein
MKVGWQMRRLQSAAPATGLLLLARQPELVLQVCAHLHHDPLPKIFAVADGFLLKCDKPIAHPCSRAIRLRQFAENLFLPSDGELLPALLEDEVLALAGERGYVFLPEGRVLEFAPERPVPLGRLLGVEHLHRGEWRPLPAGETWADDLIEIGRELQQPSADEFLTGGDPEISSEAPLPQDASVPSQAIGKASLGIGKGLAWLGRVLHLKGLSRLGARWMASAFEWAPRLSAEILGRQEAALRALLREFREGNIDKALRRALPLGTGSERGSVSASDARLPLHDLLYSLQKLLGESSAPASVWFGGFDVQAELAREYRKQAEAATRRGDYRRAAFIYGKLLADFGMAARVLEQGGLHLDAAVIYLEKVNDARAAARAYEAGGAIEQALKLYLEHGDHERAGDLLRRVGEDERALTQYENAARKLLDHPDGHYQAGEIMLHKAGRSELALRYYKVGWALRPQGSPLACAKRMGQLYAGSENPAPIWSLLSEVEDYLRPHGHESEAADFFNEIARLAESPHLADKRSLLRERALLGIAGKIRQRIQIGKAKADTVSNLLGQGTVWPSAVVSDAQFAVKLASRPAAQPKADTSPYQKTTIIGAVIPVVTAATWAPLSGDIFIGFESGEVVCFRPKTAQVIPFPRERSIESFTRIMVDAWNGGTDVSDLDRPPPVISLATGPAGDTVVVLRGHSAVGIGFLASYQRGTTGVTSLDNRQIPLKGQAWLTSLWEGLVGICTGAQVEILQERNLVPITHIEKSVAGWDRPAAGLLLPTVNRELHATGGLFLGSRGVWYFDNCLRRRPRDFVRIGWTPAVPEGGDLKTPQLSWHWNGANELELAGITNDHSLYWSKLRLEAGRLSLVSTQASALKGEDDRYLAAAIIRPGVLAAVTQKHVAWFRCGSMKGLNNYSMTAIPSRSVVACFPFEPSEQLVLIERDGTVLEIQTPR